MNCEACGCPVSGDEPYCDECFTAGMREIEAINAIPASEMMLDDLEHERGEL
jgi:hypothetical protein